MIHLKDQVSARCRFGVLAFIFGASLVGQIALAPLAVASTTVKAKPVVTKPVVTKPVVTKPVVTKPVVTKPKATKAGPLTTKRDTTKAQVGTGAQAVMLSIEQARTLCEYNESTFLDDNVTGNYGCDWGSTNGAAKVFAKLRCLKTFECTLALPDGSILPADALQGIADTILFVVPPQTFIAFCAQRTGKLTTYDPTYLQCDYTEGRILHKAFRTKESTIIFLPSAVMPIAKARALFGQPLK